MNSATDTAQAQAAAFVATSTKNASADLVASQKDPAAAASARRSAFAATWSSASKDFADGRYGAALKDVVMGKEAKQLAVEALAVAGGLYVGENFLERTLTLHSVSSPIVASALYAVMGLLALDAAQTFMGSKIVKTSA
jgi:hypothetical protein